MTKKTTLLALFLIAFYSYKGQHTSSAKSLLSGVEMNYSTENYNEDIPYLNIEMIESLEATNNDFYNNTSYTKSYSKNTRSITGTRNRMKKRISVYKLN